MSTGTWSWDTPARPAPRAPTPKNPAPPNPARAPGKPVKTAPKTVRRHKPPSNAWSVSRLTDARFSAQRQRADALLLVAQGIAEIWDVLREAGKPEGRALTRIGLRQLLSAQPGWSRRRASEAVEQVVNITGSRLRERSLSDLDLLWLLDTRLGGIRFMALCDVMTASRRERDDLPWAGFPFAPAPFDAAWVKEGS